jgi:hypothetical protein
MDRRAVESEAIPLGFTGVQFVQKVPTAQLPSFLLPRDAGEDSGRGLNRLIDLTVLNALRQ